MRYGFIGTGNMGGALARALLKKVDAKEIGLANRTKEKAVILAEQLGAAVTDNKEIASNSKYIFLGVKPQMMADCLLEINEVLAAREDRFVLVTMAAGISIERISELAGGDYPIIRIMPNTPASIGEGVILLCSKSVRDEELSEFKTVMSEAGMIDEIDEKLIDAASAVSGCGPAFAYMVIEALADGAVRCGVPRTKATLYAAKMLEGSAALVLESGRHPGELKDAVCSPGGSTIAGVHALEAGGMRGLFMDAVVSAYERTRELG